MNSATLVTFRNLTVRYFAKTRFSQCIFDGCHIVFCDPGQEMDLRNFNSCAFTDCHFMSLNDYNSSKNVMGGVS